MRWLLTIAILMVTTTAVAHEVRPAFVKIAEISSDSESTRFAASFRQPQVDGRFLGLSLGTNCEAQDTGASVTEGALIETSELTCDNAGLRRIEVVGLERTLIDALVSITWLSGTTTNRLITAQAGTLNLDSETPAVPVYLSMGVKHLLTGYDHILFVLMLLYLVRKPLLILGVVTSFTLAHSITLALAAFDIVTLPSAPVEAVIAGSIVLLAYENLRSATSLSHRFPLFIAFSFGLLHGLGFAGVLKEIGLPAGGELMALLLFNIGIELGQLAIVAVVLLFLAVNTFHFNRLIREAPVYLAGGVATFWFLQRATSILLPI